ncbi:MAG: hypothetical protein ACP5JP_04280 [bacterium]
MKRKNKSKSLNQDTLKLLNSAEQHFLTARREDLLAISDIMEFLRQTIEKYDNNTGIATLSSLLTTLQLLTNLTIKNIIDPLRMGEIPVDSNEVIYMVNNFIDQEVARIEKIDPQDPRIQVLWSIKEMLKGKRKQEQKKKNVKRVIIE